ncbi:MAG TPA: hypothetical protein VFW19_17990 [Allosphingosinicella sp.]|nr:hypothetical protein [Allosphingosinicella sp.]
MQLAEPLFKDRVRERDLDNFLIEELHSSEPFRDWLLAHLGERFSVPSGCELKLHKSPPRYQDARQTDVRIGWFDASGNLRACVLIESKVTADFQPGQSEAYLQEVAVAARELGRERVASLLVAPASKLASLPEAELFDARVSIEAMAEALRERRGDQLPIEIDARLAIRIDLLEALCGKRSAGGWIGSTVPEKRDFAQQYAALAAEMLPQLRVRPSSDGPKALTRSFEGLTLPDLPACQLRHEFGTGGTVKYVNALFSGCAHLSPAIAASPLLAGSKYHAVPANKSLAIRIETPGIDPTASFASQYEAVVAGLGAVGALSEWLRANQAELASLLTPEATPPPDVKAADPRAVERAFADALRQIYAECERLGYKPVAMLQMVDRWGGIETARRLLASPPSDGFARLALMGRLDLAVEALILEPRWEGVFTDAERRTARARLR